MRNSWDEDATFASLHLKKLGCGHGHDNLLHFTLFSKGRDYLVDGGRYTYVNNNWRSYFKSNMAHNTLAVDGEPNSIYLNSWINKYEARSQGAFTYSDSTFDYGEAENTAYKRFDDPVLLKRRVLYLKNENIFLIFDSFDAHDEHVYSQYFNFPNKLVESSEGIITTTYKNNNLVIRPMKDVDMKFTDEWWSPEYNFKTESKRLEMFKKAEGFTSFISVLYFPATTNLSCELVPVYSRNDVLISEKDAEAIHLKCNNKEYTIMLVHNSPVPAAHFYKVNQEIVSGEFVVVETDMGEVKKYIIKE